MPPVPEQYNRDGADRSPFDNPANEATSHRLSLNILLIIVIGAILLFICFLEYYYTQEIEDYMQQFKNRPWNLVMMFLVIYIFGCILMVPPNGVLITVAFTFSHVWGPTLGTIYAIIFNFFA